jgi:hypothetical protein
MRTSATSQVHCPNILPEIAGAKLRALVTVPFEVEIDKTVGPAAK